jgi:hypothetical protein
MLDIQINLQTQFQLDLLQDILIKQIMQLQLDPKRDYPIKEVVLLRLEIQVAIWDKVLAPLRLAQMQDIQHKQPWQLQ